MADILAVTVRTSEPLPARRARVMRRIGETRSDVGLQWKELEAAVAGGEQRSRAAMATVRNGAKWALALAALWILGRRRLPRGWLSWPRTALFAALGRFAVKQLVRRWYRGERHVEP